MKYSLESILVDLKPSIIYAICKSYNLESSNSVSEAINKLILYFNENKEDIVNNLTVKDNIILSLMDKYTLEGKVLNTQNVSDFFSKGGLVYSKKGIGDSHSCKYSFKNLIDRLIIVEYEGRFYLNPELYELTKSNRSLKHVLTSNTKKVNYTSDFENFEFERFSTKRFYNKYFKNKTNALVLANEIKSTYFYLAKYLYDLYSTNESKYEILDIYNTLISLKIGISSKDDYSTILELNNIKFPDPLYMGLIKSKIIITKGENDIETYLPYDNPNRINKSLIVQDNMQVAYESATTSKEAKMFVSLCASYISSDLMCYYEINQKSIKKAFELGYNNITFLAELSLYSKFAIPPLFAKTIDTYYDQYTSFIAYDVILIEIKERFNRVFDDMKTNFDYKKIDDIHYLIDKDDYSLFLSECEKYHIPNLNLRRIKEPKSKPISKHDFNLISSYNICDIEEAKIAKSSYATLKELYIANNLNTNNIKNGSAANPFDYQGKLTLIKDAIKNKTALVIATLNDDDSPSYEIIKPLGLKEKNEENCVFARNVSSPTDSYYPIRLILYLNKL